MASALILDGFLVHDPLRPRMTTLLSRVLGEQGIDSRNIPIHELRLGACSGCFECFVRSPGGCRLRDDGPSVLTAIRSSELLILVGRLSFGGYSAEMKRIVDRVLPLLLPFFANRHGEFHHPPRYPKLPRLVAFGVVDDSASDPDGRDARIFRTLVGRNAINLSAPSYAAEILSGDATDAELAGKIQASLTGSDPWPWARELRALAPKPHPVRATTDQPSTKPRLLSLVGSPKLGPSTSAAIGDYVSKVMRGHGWETESLKLKGDLKTQAGRDELVAAVDRASLIHLAFPLYVDALHCRPTQALEILAASASRWGSTPKRMMGVANCGFPEPHQNLVALAICERFAAQVGWHWCGGLALGAGEAIGGSVPLDAPRRSGHLPGHNLRHALELSLSEIAEGRNIPDSAQALLNKSPIPGLPQAGWRLVFRFMGHRGWRELGRRWGVVDLEGAA